MNTYVSNVGKFWKEHCYGSYDWLTFQIVKGPVNILETSDIVKDMYAIRLAGASTNIVTALPRKPPVRSLRNPVVHYIFHSSKRRISVAAMFPETS